MYIILANKSNSIVWIYYDDNTGITFATTNKDIAEKKVAELTSQYPNNQYRASYLSLSSDIIKELTQ